jgi:hypothetical protein
LNSLNWLLDILYSLNLFLNWLVNNLSFDSLVFNSFSDSFLWNVFDVTVLINLWNIFSLVFNCVVVGNFFLFWNVFNSLNFFVINHGFFIWNIFNSAFSSNRFSNLLDLAGSNKLGSWGLSDDLWAL